MFQKYENIEQMSILNVRSDTHIVHKHTHTHTNTYVTIYIYTNTHTYIYIYIFGGLTSVVVFTTLVGSPKDQLLQFIMFIVLYLVKCFTADS